MPTYAPFPSDYQAKESIEAGDRVLVYRRGANMDDAVSLPASLFEGGGGGGPSPANPSASLGLAAINGAAATYMRSDAAPAISQAIVPTWTGQHIFAQGAITTSKPISVTQTWNDGAVTFRGVDINITDTASAAASILMDVRLASTSLFRIDKDGSIIARGANASHIIGTTGGANTAIGFNNGRIQFLSASTPKFSFVSDAFHIRAGSEMVLGFSSGSNSDTSAMDCGFYRISAGVIQLCTGTGDVGAGLNFPRKTADADAAAPTSGFTFYSKQVAGKNAVFVRFPTGVVQQLAIEL